MKERSLRSVATILVFVAIFGGLAWFLFASGFVYNVFEPQVKAGKLGAGQAGTLSTGLEYVLAFLGTVGLFLARIGGMLSHVLFKFVLSGFADGNDDPIASEANTRMERDMMNLLVEKMKQGRYDFVAALLNEMAGNPVVTAVPQERVWPTNDEPTSEELAS